MSIILDLTRLLPGPLAARIMAEMGYQVLRLEPPQGDLMQHLSTEAYGWLNRGKETQTLDLKSPGGVEALKNLVKDAVVLLETNRPGVMERLGVGPDILRSLNPKLTYVRLAGYREEAFRSAPGHDLTYLAADGLLGRFEGVWPGLQLADASSAFWGALAAQQGMLQGGGFYEVYLAEAARTLAYPVVPNLSGDVLCYGLYQTLEGTVALGALEDHFWQHLCKGLERLEWSQAAFSPAKQGNPVYQALCAVFLSRNAQAWEDWGLANGVPLRAVQPAQTPEQLLPWSVYH